VSAAVPLMEKLGVATRAEVDPATLSDRLVAETLAADGCVICPPMTGAWAVRPASPDRGSDRSATSSLSGLFVPPLTGEKPPWPEGDMARSEGLEPPTF
jgi:hypothetical protein